MTAAMTPKSGWTNFPKPPRPRKSLKSAAEGTLANIGRVVHPVGRAADVPHGEIGGFRPPRRQKSAAAEGWHPYVPQLHGSVVRRVHEQKRPPNCIHCGGPTGLAGRLISHSHVEKVQTRWVCSDPACLGHLDAVIYVYPTGEYERRC